MERQAARAHTPVQSAINCEAKCKHVPVIEEGLSALTDSIVDNYVEVLSHHSKHPETKCIEMILLFSNYAKKTPMNITNYTSVIRFLPHVLQMDKSSSR